MMFMMFNLEQPIPRALSLRSNCSVQVIKINDASDEMGSVCKALYDRVRAVQAGEVEDKFGWMEPI